MEFDQPIMQVDGKKLKCTERHGRLLVSSVQITHELVVPPRTEMAVPSRVATQKFCPLGVLEGQTDRPPRKPPEPPASRPASLRASEVSLPEGEGLGRWRWQTQTAPHIAVVEAEGRTMIKKLLEQSQPSSCIPGLRSRRAATLELDAEDLEDEARRLDDIRWRARRLNPTEEGALREEAVGLRTAAAQFRHLVGLLTN